jgi:ABC-2 type transport system permease protein
MDKYLNLAQVQGIVYRHLFEWRRNLDRVVDSFWWALMDLIFWGLTSSYLKQNNPGIPNIVALFLGGIILWIFVQNSQRDITMPILNESWNRNLINLFTTPIRLREFVAGSILLGLIKLFFTTVVLTLTALILYKFNIFSLGWYLIPGLINLILVGWWVGFIINGLILRFGNRVESFAWAFIFVIYPFSAIFYPVKILPIWAQIIARLLPTSYVFENMRNVVFYGTFDPGQILLSLVLNILYLSLALLFLHKMFAQALDKARLVKLI